MVCCDAGLEMILVFGVSKRILPSLARHMREDDCCEVPPPAGCILVEQSEQEGGTVIFGISGTAGLSLTHSRRFFSGQSLKAIRHEIGDEKLLTFRIRHP